MMGEEIKVDYAAFGREAKRLKNAIEAFEPFTKNFTEQTAARLEGMNSDFISSLRGVLQNMADDTGPELLAQIKTFEQKVDLLGKEFKSIDASLILKED